MSSKQLILSVCLGFINIMSVLSLQDTTSNWNDTEIVPSAGNLMLTFGPDEIPEAFYHNEGENEEESRVSAESQNLITPSYSTCQDGSGGLCVATGNCPAGEKVEKSRYRSETACKTGQECCYTLPTHEKSCRLRGGSCTPATECGNAPKLRDAIECDFQKGEVCCIWTVM